MPDHFCGLRVDGAGNNLSARRGDGDGFRVIASAKRNRRFERAGEGNVVVFTDPIVFGGDCAGVAFHCNFSFSFCF